MDNFTGQWPNPIDINELKKLIPIEDVFIFDIPEEIDKVEDKIIKVHAVLGISDLRELAGDIKFYNPDIYYIFADLKANTILNKSVELVHLIADQYREIMGSNNINNYKQIVEIPIVFKDLAPGDTYLNFDVYTKRQLVNK